LLANYLDKNLPPERFAPISAPPVAEVSTPNVASSIPVQTNTLNVVAQTNNGTAIDLIAQQLQLLGKQLELLKGNNSAPAVIQETPIKEVKSSTNSSSESLTEEEIKEHKKPFGASPRIERQSLELN